VTVGVVALGAGAALLGIAVTVSAWAGRGRSGRLLGRASLLALLGSVAVGLVVMGALAVALGV
jgi:hypothetical protein